MLLKRWGSIVGQIYRELKWIDWQLKSMLCGIGRISLLSNQGQPRLWKTDDRQKRKSLSWSLSFLNSTMSYRQFRHRHASHLDLEFCHVRSIQQHFWMRIWIRCYRWFISLMLWKLHSGWSCSNRKPAHLSMLWSTRLNCKLLKFWFFRIHRLARKMSRQHHLKLRSWDGCRFLRARRPQTCTLLRCRTRCSWPAWLRSLRSWDRDLLWDDRPIHLFHLKAWRHQHRRVRSPKLTAGTAPVWKYRSDWWLARGVFWMLQYL